MTVPSANRAADVIVIGAGVLGAFHAYFAARRGLSVLLLERNALPNDASVRNFGMAPQSIVDPDGPWAAFAADTATIYRAIQAEHDISVSERGSLYLASSELERTVLGEFAERYQERFACRYLDGRETQESYPYTQKSHVQGALLFPYDLGLDPRLMLRRLIPYLETLGVTYVPHSTVTAVATQGRECTVRTAWGDVFVGEHVFVCSGAEVQTLFPAARRRSGLRVCKLQMMRTVPVPDVRLEHSILSGLSIRRYPAFTSCPSFPLLLKEVVDEKLQSYGIHLLIKQEADGSVVIGDSHQYATMGEESVFSERTNSTINECILDYARSMLNLPSWQIQSLWNGYYLVHDREAMWTETIEERVHLVTGIGGKGMSTGPALARQSLEKALG